MSSEKSSMLFEHLRIYISESIEDLSLNRRLALATRRMLFNLFDSCFYNSPCKVPLLLS